MYGIYLCEIILTDHSWGHSTDRDSSLLSTQHNNKTQHCLKQSRQQQSNTTFIVS